MTKHWPARPVIASACAGSLAPSADTRRGDLIAIAPFAISRQSNGGTRHDIRPRSRSRQQRMVPEHWAGRANRVAGSDDSVSPCPTMSSVVGREVRLLPLPLNIAPRKEPCNAPGDCPLPALRLGVEAPRTTGRPGLLRELRAGAAPGGTSTCPPPRKLFGGAPATAIPRGTER